MQNPCLKIICLLFPILATYTSAAQSKDTSAAVLLDSVVVRAFEQNKSWVQVPAAVNYIGRSVLQRFGPASVVAAINTTPGLRMEERSPGSYRFNIRGSSLRSPFGVRNVKVYYNDLPFTDPGGHTYLNNLGFYNYGSVEVIKGPGSSVYGAGTGGVLLIDAMPVPQSGFTAAYTVGSYGWQQGFVSAAGKTEKSSSEVHYQHQQSKGYRQHSRLQRNVVSWNGRFDINEKNTLKTTVLFSDLYYQTPGALTLAEFRANPKGYRPSGGGFPAAAAAQAAIYQKMFLAGISYTSQLSSAISNKTIAYGAYTQLKNPAIRNYGVVNEPHTGARSVFTLQRQADHTFWKVNAGAEWQQGVSQVNIHNNNLGSRDSLQSTDDITNRQAFIFVQASVERGRWLLTAGASLNSLKIDFQRWQPQALTRGVKTFSNQAAPRLAAMYRLGSGSIYASVAKGFSPPATSELLPTGSDLNTDLDAEVGWNYDIGWKAVFFNRLTVDVNAFYFALQNTVVQRRDAGGGEYFTNAGKTKQQGVEAAFAYTFPFLFARNNIWLSYTYHHFQYQSFRQLANDYSGKRLPGTAPHTLATGYDLALRNGFSAALTYYYSAALPLNDANTAYADAYHLLGAKLGWHKNITHHWKANISAGAENLLNQTYSLGNDVNGFGGRYFNAAPGRTFYVSVAFSWFK